MEQILQIFVSGILSGGIYALASVGLALIFGVVGLVNFAHGEFLMLAMYFAYWIYSITGLDPYQSMIINMAAMALIGYLIFKIIMVRVLGSDHSIQMLITLALSMELQNLALMLWKADYRSIRLDITNATFNIGAITLNTPRVIAFAIALGTSILLCLYLQKTFSGAAMRAISQNGKAAELMGINIKRTYLKAFVIGTVLVGLAGLLISPIYPAFPLVGANFSTLAFIVVVLGGLSSVPGAIFGGLIIGVVESFAGYYAGPAYQQAAYFLLFILVLIFMPNGLFGKR